MSFNLGGLRLGDEPLSHLPVNDFDGALHSPYSDFSYPFLTNLSIGGVLLIPPLATL